MQRENAKERIEQACLELLKTMSLESLRTQELIERAGVSRSTFYRLYQDKYEVANGIYRKQTENQRRTQPFFQIQHLFSSSLLATCWLLFLFCISEEMDPFDDRKTGEIAGGSPPRFSATAMYALAFAGILC